MWEVWEVWEVWGEGGVGRWGDGEMGRGRCGEMGRWGDGEMGIQISNWLSKTALPRCILSSLEFVNTIIPIPIILRV
ncbi:MAG: hypothetical protein F6J94_32685 [Moorea sp. SIO1F2]|uniref:hypothetical protein n=1 Tax=Moorena sp. SIO1F2 TaxID=2607819 RepID=UPI0013B9BBB3|nr:hypothetical protein [Moorena sp. SIO1F2]NET86438.1 hypothetical protein [Moorena sp. SIO1F2]